MKQNTQKIAFNLAFFMILAMILPVTVPGNANSATVNSQDSIKGITDEPTFNTTQGTRLIYNVENIMNGSYNYLTLNNGDGYGSYPVGNITTGDQIAFDFEGYGNDVNGNYISGSIRSVSFNGPAQNKYYLVDPDVTLEQNMGPPLLYFVIPAFNVSEVVDNFTNAGFSVNVNGHFMELIYKHYQPQSGGEFDVDVIFNIMTGSLDYYNYSLYSVDSPINLILSFDNSVNPGSFNPTFALTNPALFYNINSLQIGTGHVLDFSTFNDSNSNGHISQGQNALIQLETSLTDGPDYHGHMTTLTGSSEVDSPFHDNSGNNGGPPDLVFILPTSSNPNWWSNISLWLSFEGLSVVAQNSTSITFRQFDPHSTNNNVTLTLSKETGLLLSYQLLSVDAFNLPGTETPGILNLGLTLLSSYDLTPSVLNPTWGETAGKQFEYHIETLNFNGSTSAPVQAGTFQEGQDLHILLDSLAFGNGPEVNVTLSTVTGQVNSTVNYDIFSQDSGAPLLLLPIMPLTTDGVAFSYFADIFQYIAGATVTNNATMLLINVQNIDIGSEVHLNHLIVSWDKTTGLMKSYDIDAVNPHDSNQVIKLKITYVGESTGSSIFTISAPTPGFDVVLLFAGFIAIVVFTRKSSKN